MKKIIFAIIPFLFILFNNNIAFGQVTVDTTSLYKIETNDGNDFIGNIMSEVDGKISLKTEKLGVIAISRLDIKKITKIEVVKVVDGSYWLENPQAARYFFAPNGYGLKAGEGYYQNVWVLFNQFSVGITDNISLGGGIVPLFLLGVGSINPVWFVPKFSIPIVKDEINVGGGALIGTVLGEDGTGFGIVYGSGTFGSRDKNVTFGLGYGYAGGDWANTPMVNLSAMIRVGPRGYILTENYWIDTGGSSMLLLSFGGRSMVKRIGIDYGVFVPINEDIGQFIAIPWLGFTVPFLIN